MRENNKVLIIGAGIVGVCLGRELRAAGYDVTIVDKGSAGYGCSFGNAGWVTPCFAMPLPQPGMLLKSIGWLLDSTSPLYIKPSLDPELFRWLLHFNLAMNRKRMLRSIEALTAISNYSLSFYTEFASRAGADVDFRRGGLLMVSGTDDGVQYARNEMNLMAQHGIGGEFLEGEKLLAFEPTLRPIVKGGVFFPNEAQIEPLVATRKIADEFVAMGGRLQGETEVYDFTLNQGRIEEVVTTKGRMRADLVILAAGSWAPEVARRLGVRVPILGGKGYSMLVDGMQEKPRRSIMIVDRKIAVTPRTDGVRLAGTLELVNQDFSISPTRVNAIYKGAQEYLKLDGISEPTNLWRGLRPCTPDGVPLIGFSGKHKNLFYCTGHQMLGLQSAPGSAKLAAELIAGSTPYTDPKPFAPTRYE